MITLNRFTKTAAVAGLELSLTVPAAASAADRKAQNALIGGLLGAVAGGLIGGDATGALVGAGAGAFLGASTTRGRDDYRARYDRRDVQPSYGYGQPAYGYGRPAYGYGQPQRVRAAYGATYGEYGR